ncbi:MAG: hypothetical protein H6766_06500 [Candidatus Peribacteria bacterium]|nr:MAG: hypothetical protein H6766_06500 [Candidatus Peribacteria bacterium]
MTLLSKKYAIEKKMAAAIVLFTRDHTSTALFDADLITSPRVVNHTIITNNEAIIANALNINFIYPKKNIKNDA